jgi:integrase
VNRYIGGFRRCSKLSVTRNASKVGKFAKTDKPAHQASAMTRKEAENFLAAVQEVRAEWYSFFLTALRAGLRKGELIALKWGDIQFGGNANDQNRYIFVQRSYYRGRFTTPKGNRSRRVDLSKQLRSALLELRDKRMLEAVMADEANIADDLVFPSHAGTVIKPDNIFPRYMQPALKRAGLRRFRFHDPRHSFGSLLIQDGASLAYVKEQMGHSSIQITVDVYGPHTWCKYRMGGPATQQNKSAPVRTRDAPNTRRVRRANAGSC